MTRQIRKLGVSLALVLIFSHSTEKLLGQSDVVQLNTITTAVPFLQIAPDARHSAMGDVGVATSPDANSAHWNASKLAFIEEKSGFAISYTPWLRNLVSDMSIMYLTGFYQVSDKTTLAASLKYFSLGTLKFTDINGNTLGEHNPNEFSLDIAGGTKLSEKFSAGGAARFIYSNLTNGVQESKRAAVSGAVDVSGYFHDDITIGDKDGHIGVGMNISNIGAKLSYSDQTPEKDFLPTNFKFGQATTIYLDDYNSLTFATDLNKLLVPTPQFDDQGNRIPSNESSAGGIFNSWGDAPRGFKEELEEYSYSLGLEYWYEKLLAIRMGYFYEHPNKGDRQYFTAGFGLRLNVFGLDASYLIANRNNPLANTFRFTLFFSFDSFKSQNKGDAGDE
ncbi:MAG: type IX secretion system outer membrane channel protein PorV [Vicingaceae bacterium]